MIYDAGLRYTPSLPTELPAIKRRAMIHTVCAGPLRRIERVNFRSKLISGPTAMQYPLPPLVDNGAEANTIYWLLGIPGR